jgi:hypothetical protein
MRRTAASLAAVVLLTVPACEKPPAPQDKGKPGPAGGKFTLGGPAGPAQVLNGTEKGFDCRLTWSAGPAEEVRLSVAAAPADRGVTAAVEPSAVKPGGAEQLRVTVSVGEAAAAGDYQVTLTGRADQAGPASHTFTVQVPKKE